VEGKNQGGNWKNTAPSRRAARSGSSASRNESQAASTTSAGSCSKYTLRLAASSPGMPARISGGMAFGLVGCWVKSENDLTSKRKLSGVRSTQSSELRLGGIP